MRMNIKKGFTLIEILVVVIIVGLLAGVAVVKLGDHMDRAQENYLKSAIVMMERGIDQVILLHNTFPDISSDTPEGRVSEIIQVLQNYDIFVHLESEFKLDPDLVFASAFPEAYSLAQVSSATGSGETILVTNNKVRKGLESGHPEAREILVLPKQGPIIFPERIELVLNDPNNPHMVYHHDNYWLPLAVKDAWDYYRANGAFASDDEKFLVLGNIGLTDMNADELDFFLTGSDADLNALLVGQIIDLLAGDSEISNDDLSFMLNKGLNGINSNEAILGLDLDNVPWEKLDLVTMSNIGRLRGDDLTSGMIDSMIDKMDMNFGSAEMEFLLSFSKNGLFENSHLDRITKDLNLTGMTGFGIQTVIRDFIDNINAEQKGNLIKTLLENLPESISDFGGFSNYNVEIKGLTQDQLNNLYSAYNNEALSMSDRLRLAGLGLQNLDATSVQPSNDFVSQVFNDIESNFAANSSSGSAFIREFASHDEMPEGLKNTLVSGIVSRQRGTLNGVDQAFLDGYDWSNNQGDFDTVFNAMKANYNQNGMRNGVSRFFNGDLSEEQRTAVIDEFVTRKGQPLDLLLRNGKFTDAEFDRLLVDYSSKLTSNTNMNEYQVDALVNNMISSGDVVNLADRFGNVILNKLTDDHKRLLYDAALEGGGRIGSFISSVSSNPEWGNTLVTDLLDLNNNMISNDRLNSIETLIKDKNFINNLSETDRNEFINGAYNKGLLSDGAKLDLAINGMYGMSEKVVNDIITSGNERLMGDLIYKLSSDPSRQSELNSTIEKYLDNILDRNTLGSNTNGNGIYQITSSITDPVKFEQLKNIVDRINHGMSKGNWTGVYSNPLYSGTDAENILRGLVSNGVGTYDYSTLDNAARNPNISNTTFNDMVNHVVNNGGSVQFLGVLRNPAKGEEAIITLNDMMTNNVSDVIVTNAFNYVIGNKGISTEDKKGVINSYIGIDHNKAVSALTNSTVSDIYKNDPELLTDIINIALPGLQGGGMGAFYRRNILETYGDVLSYEQKLQLDIWNR